METIKININIMNILIKSDIFRKLWLSYTFTSIASASLPTTVTLVILELYKDLELLGFVLASRTLGFIAGAVVSGVIADNFNHKYILVISTFLRFLATIGILFSIYSNLFIVLYCVIFMLGLGEGVFRVAYQSMMANLIPKEDLLSANASNTLSMRLSLTTIPLLTTVAFLSIGWEWLFIGITTIWLIALICLYPLEYIQEKPLTIKKQSLLKNYYEGLQEAVRHRWFIAGLFALLIWLSTSYSIQQLLLPVISKDYFQDETIIGYALGAYSLGALLAALVMSKCNIQAYGLVAFIGLSLYGLVPFSLLGDYPILIYLAYFLGGIGIEIFNIPWFTAIQREVPKDKIGRVSSLDFLVSYGVSPLALAILPFLISSFGSNLLLIICGFMTISAALLALLIPGSFYLKEKRVS